MNIIDFITPIVQWYKILSGKIVIKLQAAELLNREIAM
jgi:hypothetical protein